MKDIDTRLLDLLVLYVEDEDMIRQAVNEYLGFRVRETITAANGKEGLERFRDKKPDLVITDIKMPYLNGIEMSEEIRSSDAGIPIIITTAYNETEFLISANQIGINDFLIKPLNLAKLDELLLKYEKLVHDNRKST